MYKAIPHTADEAYEISFRNEVELFEDMIDIIKGEAEYELRKEVREEEYKLSEDLLSDVFDVTNDMIYMVDKGWIPIAVNVEEKEAFVIYQKADVKRFDFKALTYHMELSDVGNLRILKVVFDV